MAFEVRVKKQALKKLPKLPSLVQEKFAFLTRDLKEKGPVQAAWPNYSKLGKDQYHCHLNYSYVACWTYQKETITIEVYYVGSRQSAPY
ncbi:MAG: hypothetical protein M3Y08_12505 [Fibrobacterota bacterium]|nr:hypothetical protein [Fibrobacterota bacterium]